MATTNTNAAPLPPMPASMVQHQGVQLVAGKPYNPGTGINNNARSWQAIQAALNTHGGKATVLQVYQAVSQYNHASFVKYALARGWLAPAKGQPNPIAKGPRGTK